MTAFRRPPSDARALFNAADRSIAPSRWTRRIADLRRNGCDAAAPRDASKVLEATLQLMADQWAIIVRMLEILDPPEVLGNSRPSKRGAPLPRLWVQPSPRVSS
jgi:hypothetical protein